jgi:hypothetical protein
MWWRGWRVSPAFVPWDQKALITETGGIMVETICTEFF